MGRAPNKVPSTAPIKALNPLNFGIALLFNDILLLGITKDKVILFQCQCQYQPHRQAPPIAPDHIFHTIRAK